MRREETDFHFLINWLKNIHSQLLLESIPGNHEFLGLLWALIIKLWHRRTDLEQGESPQFPGGLRKPPSSGEYGPACLPC